MESEDENENEEGKEEGLSNYNEGTSDQGRVPPIEEALSLESPLQPIKSNLMNPDAGFRLESTPQTDQK
jgi:hypothetical protein